MTARGMLGAPAQGSVLVTRAVKVRRIPVTFVPDVWGAKVTVWPREVPKAPTVDCELPTMWARFFLYRDAVVPSLKGDRRRTRTDGPNFFPDCYKDFADMMKIPYTAADAALLPDWIKAAQAGDVPARNRVISHTMRLVVREAAKFAQRNGRPDLIDDMTQAAVMGAHPDRDVGGIVRAIQRFDPARAKWSTFVMPWIRKEIREVLASGCVAPDWVKRRQAQVRVVADRLWTELGREPNVTEVIDAMRKRGRPMSAAIVREALTAPVTELSWESETEGRDEGAFSSTARRCLVDHEAPDEDDLADALDGDRRFTVTREAAEALRPPDRTVIAMTFGLGCEPAEDATIATAVGVSRQQVGQIRERALAALRRKVARRR